MKYSYKQLLEVLDVINYFSQISPTTLREKSATKALANNKLRVHSRTTKVDGWNQETSKT